MDVCEGFVCWLCHLMAQHCQLTFLEDSESPDAHLRVVWMLCIKHGQSSAKSGISLAGRVPGVILDSLSWYDTGSQECKVAVEKDKLSQRRSGTGPGLRQRN